MTETTHPCVDCARLKIAEQRPTRYCPIDGAWRCRAHRGAQLERAGVGAPVWPTDPRPAVGLFDQEGA